MAPVAEEKERRANTFADGPSDDESRLLSQKSEMPRSSLARGAAALAAEARSARARAVASKAGTLACPLNFGELDYSRYSGTFPADESERNFEGLILSKRFKARVDATPPMKPFCMQAAAPAGMEIYSETCPGNLRSCDTAGYPPKAVVAPAALRQAQVAAQARRCWQFP